MNPLESIYQFLASLFIKIGRLFGISVTTQFRLVLGLVAVIQTLMTLVGMYLFTSIGLYFPNFDEAIYIYIFVYTLIITVLTAKQWKTVFEERVVILDYFNDKELPAEDRLKFLKKTRESYTFALSLAAVMSIVFWALFKRNTELIALIMIPATLDILANGLATAWEIAVFGEATSKQAVDI